MNPSSSGTGERPHGASAAAAAPTPTYTCFVIKCCSELTVQADGAICFTSWIFRHAFVRPVVGHRHIEYRQLHVGLVRWAADVRLGAAGRTSATHFPVVHRIFGEKIKERRE